MMNSRSYPSPLGVRPVITVSKNLVSVAPYSLGQKVKVGEETFFVITENDTINNDTITLISKYNLDPSSNTQLNGHSGQTKMAFCPGEGVDNSYWRNISEITYPYELNGVESPNATVYNKAVAYGDAKGGTGRLLTYDEANKLIENSKTQKIICGQYSKGAVVSDGYLNYWLGTTGPTIDGRYMVWTVQGQYSGYLNYSSYWEDGSFGVRPVITINKSLVTAY